MELKIYDKDLHADIISDKVIKKGIRKIYYVSSRLLKYRPPTPALSEFQRFG